MNITEKIENLGLAKYLGTFKSGTQEWHNARAGIGGSDIGAILGYSQYKSAFTLWAEKIGRIDGVTSTIPMRLGTALEPAIRDFFATENKDWLKIHETGTWQSTKYDWAKANPDAIIEWDNGELGVLEIKHSATYVSEIPKSWELQVQWYLTILGLKRGIVCAVIGGRYTEFSVSVDDSLSNDLITRVVAFYDLVITETEPALDGSDSTYETVREISDGLVDGELELGNLWIDLMAAKVIHEEAERVLNMKKSVTLAFMNGTKVGTYEGNRVISLQARNGKPFITFSK